MGVPGLGWLCGMLGVVSLLFPYVAFGVTKSWEKTLQAFGFKGLVVKGVVFILRAVLYLVMTAATPAASQAIMGSVLLSCIGACFTACIILSLISHESNHGEEPQVVTWFWPVILTFLAGMGFILHLIKERQQVGDLFVAVIIIIIIALQLWQSVRPLIILCSSSEAVGDEAFVAAIKTMAILVAIVTSLYSSWSWDSLKPYVTDTSLVMHWILCVAGVTAGLLQLLMRLMSTMDKVAGVFLKLCAITNGPLQLVGSCLDVAIESMEHCAATISSCFSAAIQWMKRLFGRQRNQSLHEV